MIQRIQTLFLILAVAAVSLMFFFPIATYSIGMLQVVFSITNKTAASDLNPSDYIPLWPMLTSALLVVFLILVSIFLYSKRRVQMKVVMLSVLINMILIISVFMLADRLMIKLNNSISNYELGAFLPIASLVFLMLAYRGIRRDERLVRSADRLR